MAVTVHETLTAAIDDAVSKMRDAHYIGAMLDSAELAELLASDPRLVIGTAPEPVPERPPLWGPEGPVVGHTYPVEMDNGETMIVRWKGGYWEVAE